MLVAELWLYPVKSLRGEQLDETEITASGIPGDRLVHARRPEGRVLMARTPHVLRPGRVAVGDAAELLGYWTLPRTA